MSYLLALAERCERAEGPERGLLRDIVCELGWAVRIPGSAEDGSQDGWHDLDQKLPAFPRPFDLTASIDAALTLKEGVGVLITLSEIKGDGMPLCVIGNPETAELFEGIAATPALALCAAALRARAA